VVITLRVMRLHHAERDDHIVRDPNVNRSRRRLALLACLALAPLTLAEDLKTVSLGPLDRLTHDGLDKQRPSWAPDGRHLLFARQTSDGAHIWQYVRERGTSGSWSEPRRLSDRKDPEYHGVFAPDGHRVLFTAITLSGTQGNLDIAAIDADGSGLKTIVGDRGKLSHQDWPSWAPDGRRFAFSSTHEGNQEIYTASAHGGEVVRLTQNPGHDAHPCWSPDGKTIAFTTDRWGGLELAAVQPDGTGLTRLTHSPGLDDYPAYSPTGARLAFVSNRDGQFEVYVAAADGGDPINISRHPGRDSFPTWTPDGAGVTFVSDRDGGCDLYTQGLVFVP
jgi:TolB protein